VNNFNQNWVFGSDGRLAFTTFGPTLGPSHIMNTFEGSACISDANGNLVAYSDGLTVRDGNNALRASGLLGNASSTQSALIVPDPGQADAYYMCTTDGWSGNSNDFDGIWINTNPWGAPTPLSAKMILAPPKSTVSTPYSPTEKQTAVQHANCRDFWVLTVVQSAPQKASNAKPAWLRVFLINPAGMSWIQDIPLGDVLVHDQGYMKGSRDGQRLALANWENQNVLVYPFDTVLGTVDTTKLITLSVPASDFPAKHAQLYYGVEFSPNSNVLYFTVVGDGTGGASQTEDGYVYQCDLLPSTQNPHQVGVHPNAGGRYSIGALQLAMDDRIYIAKDNEPSLGSIASPDLLGPLCGLNFNAFTFPATSGATCTFGLPNLIANLCDCSCDTKDHEGVEAANRALHERSAEKAYTIMADGQAAPASHELALPGGVAPLFSFHFGDLPSGRRNSPDALEVFIEVRNRFIDLAFKGLTLFNLRVAPRRTSPSGEAAAELIPSEVVYFDEIQPCSSVTRDFVLLIRHPGAECGNITFEYTVDEITVMTARNGKASFDLENVPDRR
jgi:hypothetical protein